MANSAVTPTAFYSPFGGTDTDLTMKGLYPYAHGGSYNGGGAPTITLSSGGGTLNTVNMSEFIPYQLKDGSWRMRFNMRLNLSATARTTVVFAINGVTFFNTGGNGQVVTGAIYSVVSIFYVSAGSNVNTIEFVHASSSVNEYNLSGDVKLASKPTWAY